MGEINCDFCGEEICKYAMDFRACGGIKVIFENGKEKNICLECAKKISLEVINLL